MSRITPEQFETLVREGVPLAAQFEPQAVRLEPGLAHIRIPFKPQFVRPGGTITGPIVMALADIAVYAAVMTRLGPVEAAVTTHLSASFMRRPAPAPLVAEARLLKLGKRLAFADVLVFSEGDPEPVAQVGVTYAVPPTA
jgi:uncharacterized protein (TIGR00369 family)